MKAGVCGACGVGRLRLRAARGMRVFYRGKSIELDSDDRFRQCDTCKELTLTSLEVIAFGKAARAIVEKPPPKSAHKFSSAQRNVLNTLVGVDHASVTFIAKLNSRSALFTVTTLNRLLKLELVDTVGGCNWCITEKGRAAVNKAPTSTS